MTPRLLVSHRARARQGEIPQVEARHVLFDVVRRGHASRERLCEAGINRPRERIAVDAPPGGPGILVQPCGQSSVDHRLVAAARPRRPCGVTGVSVAPDMPGFIANLAWTPTGNRRSL